MNNKDELTKYLHLIFKIGTGVMISILAGFSLGLMLDNWLNLNGVGIMGGVIVGVLVGFGWIYQEVMKIE
tara:strand:+ start:978 stop:1187 length:210 start_codon:yes stop_codon:yes gene_type:complete